ncbi:MAG: serine protease, partial [Pseudomonadota bacterium]
MAGDSYFLTKSDVARAQMVPHGAGPVIERYDTLAAAISKAAGPEAAGLFAEPVLSRGNDVAPSSVAWYTRYDGEARPLGSLEGPARARAEQDLRDGLLRVADGLTEPSAGLLIGAALNIKSLDDIYVIGGRPVLTNWGLAPDGANPSSPRRQEHFAATLGRYLPLDEAPAISSEEWRGRLAGVTAALAAGAAAQSAAASEAQSAAAGCDAVGASE